MSATEAQHATPGAPGVSYYMPLTTPSAGTALATEDEVPTLFTPLQLRSLTLHNRFAVSPMCTYSADDGHLTDWHLVHLGAFALRGAALTIVEATAVTPNGRISPEDSGLWQDSQIGPLRRIADYFHSQGQKIGIQLAHAGRKASTLAPWLQKARGEAGLATAEQKGWPENVWAPSAIQYSPTFAQPREMTIEEIKGFVVSYAQAAERAIKAGMDTVEIHAAHGYLLHEFFSPITNKRTDAYGGSFENRTRLLFEVIAAVRAVIPETMPLLLRISGTDWMEHSGEPSWDVPQAIRLAKLLPDAGVDLLDISSGGITPGQKIKIHPYYQIDIASRVREEVRAEGKQLLIGGVGMVTTAEMARDVVQADGAVDESEGGHKAKADLVLIARQFLKEPEFVLRTAHKLGVHVMWPTQYHRAGWPKGSQL